MPQFVVYRNLDSRTRKTVPYLLDVQSDLLEPLATRVVAPLIVAEEIRSPMQRLNPEFEIEGIRVVMSTAEIAGIPKRVLGQEVCSLCERRPDIIAALDLLLTGI
jgi:toxin CcdB